MRSNFQGFFLIMNGRGIGKDANWINIPTAEKLIMKKMMKLLKELDRQRFFYKTKPEV